MKENIIDKEMNKKNFIRMERSGSVGEKKKKDTDKKTVSDTRASLWSLFYLLQCYLLQ